MDNKSSIDFNDSKGINHNQMIEIPNAPVENNNNNFGISGGNAFNSYNQNPNLPDKNENAFNSYYTNNFNNNQLPNEGTHYPNANMNEEINQDRNLSRKESNLPPAKLQDF